jgi:hypothetical protein
VALDIALDGYRAILRGEADNLTEQQLLYAGGPAQREMTD